MVSRVRRKRGRASRPQTAMATKLAGNTHSATRASSASSTNIATSVPTSASRLPLMFTSAPETRFSSCSTSLVMRETRSPVCARS